MRHWLRCCLSLWSTIAILTVCFAQFTVVFLYPLIAKLFLSFCVFVLFFICLFNIISSSYCAVHDFVMTFVSSLSLCLVPFYMCFTLLPTPPSDACTFFPPITICLCCSIRSLLSEQTFNRLVFVWCALNNQAFICDWELLIPALKFYH